MVQTSGLKGGKLADSTVRIGTNSPLPAPQQTGTFPPVPVEVEITRTLGNIQGPHGVCKMRHRVVRAAEVSFMLRPG